MKSRSTQRTVIPTGYTANNYNGWIKHIHKQIEKIKGVKVSAKASN